MKQELQKYQFTAQLKVTRLLSFTTRASKVRIYLDTSMTYSMLMT